MKKAGCLIYVVIVIISSIAALLLAENIDTQSVSVSDSENETVEDDYSVEDDCSVDDDNYEENENYVLYDDGESQKFTYYEQLSVEEQNIYDVILDGAEEGKMTFKFVDVNYTDYVDYCDRAICALTYEHPELFWLRSGFYYSESHDLFEVTGVIEITLTNYSYWDYSLDKQNMMVQLDEEVEKVAAQALGYKTDYERIQYVHDYLIENAVYDYDSLDEYYDTLHDASCEYIFSAYGCLVNGRTVCAGYAKAFQLIMNKLGYDCMYVVGDAGGPHAWNCIYVENEGYYVDVTWDDADYKYDEPIYEYFCITSEALARTHELDEMFDFPTLTAEKYNYFKYNGFYMEKYDFDGFCDIVKKQKDQHIISVQFGSLKELKKAYTAICMGGKVWNIPVIGYADDLSISVNEDHYTLTLYK